MHFYLENIFIAKLPPFFIAENVELTSTKTRQFTCPGDQVTFTCRVFESSSLEWRSPLITQPTLYLAFDVPPEVLNRDPFTASLISVSGNNFNANFTSTLQVTASGMITRTETTVMCRNAASDSETDNFTTAGMWKHLHCAVYMYIYVCPTPILEFLHMKINV